MAGTCQTLVALVAAAASWGLPLYVLLQGGAGVTQVGKASPCPAWDVQCFRTCYCSLEAQAR